MLFQQVPPDLTNLVGVITWLAAVGAPYFVGYVLSLVVENWPKWHDLPKPVKFLAPILASVGVAFLANIALQFPGYIEVVAPWFAIAMSSILGWLGTQKAYMSIKEAGYGPNYS